MRSATEALKTTSKRATQKATEASVDLIGNNISGKITRVSNNSPRNNSETNKEDILRERCTSPEERQKITDDLRLM